VGIKFLWLNNLHRCTLMHALHESMC
jgi:hypothetical protein